MLARPVTGHSFHRSPADDATPTTAGRRAAAAGVTGRDDAPAGELELLADPWRADASRAAGGDRTAFERLYRAHVARVFSVCMRMVADSARAEELTQDVFVRVWEKLPTYRGDSAVSTWLHRVAVNVVLTQRKSEGARKNRSVDDEEAIELAPARPVHVGDRLDLEDRKSVV